jgi:predicted NUDIX family phosphoesterase
LENKPLTYLEATYAALYDARRPLSSREIASHIADNINFRISGRTPWKTINARLSADILENGVNSRFVRVADGRFALRIWPDVVEYTVRRRKINPVDELIAVVPKEKFLPYLHPRNGSEFFDVDYVALFQEAHGMQRVKAEETEEFVQLIPLFFVRKGREFLTYKRTKRLPEKRLHGTRSINFGGHLQVDDFPTLFASDPNVVQESLQRELREELLFQPDEKGVRFFGAIYDQTNMFGRQHVGLVFEVTSNSEVKVDTNEPGFLTSISFLEETDIFERKDEFDDWTFLVLLECARHE